MEGEHFQRVGPIIDSYISDNEWVSYGDYKVSVSNVSSGDGSKDLRGIKSTISGT
jgi:hypothetical protein